MNSNDMGAAHGESWPELYHMLYNLPILLYCQSKINIELLQVHAFLVRVV